MSACDRYQNQMVEALYGELPADARAQFDAHLAQCAACATLHEEMRTTLSLMSQRRRPDPGDAYFEAYADRLLERMQRESGVVRQVSDGGRRRFVGSWGFRVAAAVLILAAGVWMGRSVLAPDPSLEMAARDDAREVPSVATPDTTSGSIADDEQPRDTTGASRPIDPPAAERKSTTPLPDDGMLTAASNDPTKRYLDRSQVLLMALINSDTADPEFATEIGSQRERAGALLVESGTVRAGLPRDDRRMHELVDQLELVLREIAHLEATGDHEAVDVIRDRIGREGVLLRINLRQMREADPKRAASNGSGAIDSEEEAQ